MDEQQKRLLLALAIIASIGLVWPMLMGPPAPPQQAEGSGAVVREGSAAEGTGAVTAEATPDEPIEPSTVIEAEELPPQRLIGNGFSALFSNVGARMVLTEITEPEQYIPRDDFMAVFPHPSLERNAFEVLLQGVPELSHTSTFEFRPDESEPLLADDGTPLVDDDGYLMYSRLVYRWSNGQIEIDKVFSTDPERAYVSTFDLTVREMANRTQEISQVQIDVWANGLGAEEGGLLSPMANTLEAACLVNDDLENETPGDIEGLRRFDGPTDWAGVMDRYFLTAVLAADGTRGAHCQLSSEGNYFAGSLAFDGFVLGPGDAVTLSLRTYTGPKDSSSLSAAGSGLSSSVSYGMFEFLARPMRFLLVAFFGFIPNWGIAIILLTIMIKGLLFPLTQKSFKSMERMRAIQPRMKVLQEKYKNDKTKLTEETMKLYREENVSPFGCLPMFLQMPIYLALYRTIYNSVELYKAEFAFWITDLSEQDPYYILPVLMAATMMGQQLLMPTTTDNPQMKWVMRLMPVMFGVFMLVLPSGLVLYIFISSLLGIGQQYLIRRQSKKDKDDSAVDKKKDESKLTRQQRRQRARRQSS